MTTTSAACPRCHSALNEGTRFCSNCGSDVSGVWSRSNPALDGTIAVETDPAVDTLGALLSEATLGDYDIYGELGRGGMAAVYLALDLALNRKVAIKTMLPELVSREGMVQRFKREAQTAAALSHPHIIQIYTVKQSKSLVYFVMKFIEGRSLESVIQDKGQVPIGMTQTILAQVGSALDYAHKKHVVHRDIKPANIMIDEEGWAIVTDFGIAKVQEAQNLTATGTAIGTPHYMSPEQFHNKAVTGASDQYSLGVVLYEMLSGKKPFDGSTYAEIITQHLFEPVPDLRELNANIPEHVVQVIRKMMAKDPAERFPDLDTAIHALGAPASKKEGDAVRTQMISLAKSGPQKKIRMSVPMSPIPQARQSPPPQRTVLEPKPKQTPRPRPAPEAAPPRRRGLWITIAALGLALAGGGAYVMVKTPLLSRDGSQVPSSELVTSGAGSAIAQQATGAAASSAVPPAAAAPEVAAPIVDSASIRQEALRLERARIAQDRKDSIRIANRARQRVADSIARTRLASAPKPPTPVAGAPSSSRSASSGSATVKLASSTPGAALYINGVIENLISRPRDVTIPAGVEVKLSIRAQGCSLTWDTTVVVTADTHKSIGRRGPKC